MKFSEYKEALEKYNRTYEIRKRILGEGDNLTLTTFKSVLEI